jgi:hypothetical protein
VATGGLLVLLAQAEGLPAEPPAHPPAAFPVRVEAAVDRERVAIGEPIRYTISVTAAPGLELTPPSLPASLGALELQETGTTPPRTERGQVIMARWYRLVSFEPGELRIPAPVVSYRAPDGTRREARGAPLTVTVASRLPEEWTAQDFRAIKPPIAVRRLGWWLWAAGLLSAVGAAGLIWRTRRRRLQPMPAVPAPPPHEQALAELEALRREDLAVRQRYEAYYVRLSGIVRRYVEGRFGLRAPEMTTEEFLQGCSTSAEFPASHRHLMREFLEHCDLVKFARYAPSDEEAERAFASARRFLEETAPAIPAAQPG